MHSRSLVAVAAADSNSVASHTVSAAQARSLVAVAAVDSYSVASHTVSAAHARSLVGDAGTDSNSVAGSQTVSAAHTRSLTADGAAASHSVSPHTVQSRQVPSVPHVSFAHGEHVIPLKYSPATHRHRYCPAPSSSQVPLPHGESKHGASTTSKDATGANAISSLTHGVPKKTATRSSPVAPSLS